MERELLQSAPVRRLKHLRHYGAAALVCPVVHSRLEHTLGVWALSKRFFPDWPELHAAALLHDVGHLPFSHAAEQALAFDHHLRTEALVGSGPVADVLRKYGVAPAAILETLNLDSSLSHRSGLLGLDHLDSFLRDTWAAGLDSTPPHLVVQQLSFRGNAVDADEATALHIWHAVCADNRLFLSPYLLAADAALAQAIIAYLRIERSDAAKVTAMSDAQLLAALERTRHADVRAPLLALLDEPWRIVPCDAHAPGAFEVSVRKIYDREPLADGVPLCELRSDAKRQREKLQALAGRWWYRIDY